MQGPVFAPTPARCGRALTTRCLLHLCALTNIVAASLSQYEPSKVWKHFDSILGIPRCSGNEAGMRKYIQTVASQMRLPIVIDEVGNAIVKKPPTNSVSSGTPVIVQTHLDMVCEKSSQSTHRFDKDPIRVATRDGWIIADNTTLGADNGVGVAMALALLESNDDARLPPLEFVFTTQEETGLDGARGLDVAHLQGRHLINLDSEEHGIIYIGCAGGGDVNIDLAVDRARVNVGSKVMILKVSGLIGGHSGAEIHLDRGNAIILLARALAEVRSRVDNFDVLTLSGGDADNAIPREAHAVVAMLPDDEWKVREEVMRVEAALKKVFGRVDPSLRVVLDEHSELKTDELSLDPESVERILDLLLTLPHGPIRYSSEVSGLVETSNNVARIRSLGQYHYEVLCFARSSLQPALDYARDTIKRIAQRVNGTVLLGTSFPGWAPNRSSHLLGITQDVFAKTEGKQPEIAAIHAGLECGIIGEKVPGIEMVSFGPDIQGAHAPGERVRIDSVAGVWDVLLSLLSRFLPDDDFQSKVDL